MKDNDEEAAKAEKMTDIQSEPHGGMEIKKVGVTGVQVPITVKDKSEGVQHVVGTFLLSSNLPPEQRGAHMSRFIAALEGQEGQLISLRYLQTVMLPIIRGVQEQEKGHIEVTFVYFVNRSPPLTTEMKAKLPVEVKFIVGDYHSPILGVITPIMTVCPCSLELTETKQAHSQRAYVKIEMQPLDWIWIEDIVEISSLGGSGWINPLLKRPDEKWITEYSHRHPKFVEDVAREVAELIKDQLPVSWFAVYVESEESIHPHNAFASIEWSKKSHKELKK